MNKTQRGFIRAQIITSRTALRCGGEATVRRTRYNAAGVGRMFLGQRRCNEDQLGSKFHTSLCSRRGCVCRRARQRGRKEGERKGVWPEFYLLNQAGRGKKKDVVWNKCWLAFCGIGWVHENSTTAGFLAGAILGHDRITERRCEAERNNSNKSTNERFSLHRKKNQCSALWCLLGAQHPWLYRHEGRETMKYL